MNEDMLERGINAEMTADKVESKRKTVPTLPSGIRAGTRRRRNNKFAVKVDTIFLS